MKDWEQDVLEQYDIDVKNKKKVRGGMICESEEGVYLLAETKLSERRLQAIYELQEHLCVSGFTEVDNLKKNKEEKLVTELEDGSKYCLRKWYIGRECDVKKESELLNATKNLANLHKALNQPISWEREDVVLYQGENLQQEFYRHNRELRKVRTFIRSKVDKGEFENTFLKHFDFMFAWAELALEKASQFTDSKLERKWIHGDYNYHNVLMLHNGMATTNFEHFEENVQIADFYYFLRKTMEKHHWNAELGGKMIDYYQRFLPVSEVEREYLCILLIYPEKFWKVANMYAKSKKTWIPAKNLEKLELVIEQMNEKQKFLENVFGFRL